MKNLIIAVALLMATNVFAINYKDMMIQNIEKLNNSKDPVELAEIANTFDRIAQKETNEWLPLYYSAYATICITFFNEQISNDDKATIFEKAQQRLEAAKKITDKESEIFILQAMVSQLSISMDMANAYSYTLKINEALERAELLDPKNPRIPYLRGTTLFYTPAEFGGGPLVAKSLLEKAAMLFSSADKSDVLKPNWGEYHNNIMLGQCKGIK